MFQLSLPFTTVRAVGNLRAYFVQIDLVSRRLQRNEPRMRGSCSRRVERIVFLDVPQPVLATGESAGVFTYYRHHWVKQKTHRWFHQASVCRRKRV